MIITEKTIVSFELPEEAAAAGRFREEHDDYQAIVDSCMVTFVKSTTVFTKLKGSEYE